MKDLTSLAAIGALPRSASERADDETGHVTVVLGRFDALVGRGLTQILNEDRDLRIIGTDLDDAALEHTVARQAPQVAILDDPVDNTATTGLSPELTQRSPVLGDGQAKWGQLLSAAIRIFTNRDVAVCMAPVECAAVCPP